MKTVVIAVVGGALLVAAPGSAAAPATTSSHDSDEAKVYTLDKKVAKLFPGLANRGIKTRISGEGFKITSYSSQCTRRSKVKLRCSYKFTSKLGDALGTGPSCGAATVKLVREGKALSVGPTPAESCS